MVDSWLDSIHMLETALVRLERRLECQQVLIARSEYNPERQPLHVGEARVEGEQLDVLALKLVMRAPRRLLALWTTERDSGALTTVGHVHARRL